MSPLLIGATASLVCAGWLFLILPRLQGHLDPWEREYEAALRAWNSKDRARAAQHIRAAHDLACRHDSAEGRRETLELMQRIEAS